MKITKEILEKYVNDGWVISQIHPNLPLTIYNYSQTTQYEQYWDEITMSCRGLILDNDGNVIARPFKKFFNIEENKHVETNSFDVYEKMDGSLGILFYYNNQWILATRGSFTSDQAVRGREMLSKYNLDLLCKEYTYMFEIIYNENRIVCDYDFEDLVLLGCIETSTGNYIDIHNDYYINNFNVVEKFNFKDYKQLKKLNIKNKEGFIVRFSNGDMCKIKFEDYIKLHKVLTNCSSYDIWKNLMLFGKLPEELLNNVPDEFFNWTKTLENRLRKEYTYVLNKHMAYTSSILRCGLNRKEFALRVQKLENVNHKLIFAIYDKKDHKIDEFIWHMIKPKYEKPFSN